MASRAFRIFRNYWFRCFLRRVTATWLEQKNFGPNVIYYVFWESGGPSADDVDLEVDLKSTSSRPQVNLWYLPTHLTHLPQVDLKSTSGRLGSLPRRHRSQCLHMTNGTWPFCRILLSRAGITLRNFRPAMTVLWEIYENKNKPPIITMRNLWKSLFFHFPMFSNIKSIGFISFAMKTNTKATKL